MRSPNRLDLLALRQGLRPASADLPALHDPGLLASLSRSDSFQIGRHGSAVEIRAATELALAQARLVLQQACGEQLDFGDAFAHTWVDPVSGLTMAPVMFLRIDAPKVHAHALLERLKERGAVVQRTDIERKRIVLRGEAWLADLIGFGRDVLELTDGSAQVLSWLLRYDALRATDRAGQARSAQEADA